MAEMPFSPLHEYRCKGKLIYDSREFNVDFLIKQMQNGRLVGEIKASSTTYRIFYDLLHSFKEFKLSGRDDSGSRIVVDHCYLIKLTDSIDSTVSAKFNAFEAILNPERLEDRPDNKLVAIFALLNVDETFKVKVDTQLGELYLQHIKGYKDMLSLIKTLGVSGITAVAKIFVEKSDTSLTFKEILSNLTEVVESFLCITRLADTCYHEWCSVGIYKKMKNSEDYEQVLYKMRKPKIKPPSYRRLTNPAHSSIFYESAYAGYKGREKELNELYDFNIALEWYIEANIASVLESQYLMLCTCLELLVDRYQTKTNTEFIMEQDVFKNHILPVLTKTSREIMKKLELTSDQRKEIYMKLKGLNRRSFRSGIESLLDHLKVKYDDLFDDLDGIIRIRNKITHSGIYDDINELSSTFNRLYVLLTRIFLSILNYEHDYFDWTKHDWVDFKKVCKK